MNVRPRILLLGAALVGLAACANEGSFDVCRAPPPETPVELDDGQSSDPVCVAAKVKWNPVGVRLEANGVYEIVVTNVRGWKDASYDADPEAGIECPAGWMTWRLAQCFRRHPPEMFFVLIGSIGRQHAFKVGHGTTITAPTDGPLELYANDWPGFYWNNHGLVDVAVRRLR